MVMAGSSKKLYMVKDGEFSMKSTYIQALNEKDGATDSLNPAKGMELHLA